jgi:hypothetical protein
MSLKVMTDVWEHSELAGSSLLVMLALADRANDHGYSWPGMADLIQKSRLSKRQVQRILQQLEADGYIEKTEPGVGRGHLTVYRLHAKGVMDDAKGDMGDTLSVTDDAKGDTDDTLYVTDDAKGDNMTPFSEDEPEEKVTSSAIKGDIHDIKGDIQGIKGDIRSHAHGEHKTTTKQPSDEPPPLQPRGGGLAHSDFETVARAWEDAEFRPAAGVIRDHLEKWIAAYGAEEVVAAIDIAKLSDPDKPGAFLAGVLRRREADREAEARLTARAVVPLPDLPVVEREEEPLRILREISGLRYAPMALEDGTVRVMVQAPDVAERQYARLAARALLSAGLEVSVQFVEGAVEWTG